KRVLTELKAKADKALEETLSPPEAPQLTPVELPSARSTRTQEAWEVPASEAPPDNLASQIAMLTIPEVKTREFNRVLPMQGQDRGTKTGTGVQLSGGTSDGDPYWGQVRARIDREWVAPLVELKGDRLFPVVLTFRLERSGQITDLEVEHPSGNAYFDEAAKRAILAATPLPPFPPRMTQAYQDLRFQFTVSKGSP
ncbi:MAG: energy transducer TonB, partial [Nitrospirales bacterium]